MSGETLRRAAALMRERDRDAVLFEIREAGGMSTNVHKPALAVARAYLSGGST